MRLVFLVITTLLVQILYAQQCLSGDCQNGIGKALYKDSITYEGSFKAGAANGKGKMTLKNGATIEGDYVNGKAHGKCVYTFPDKRIYTGDMQNGKIEGQGVLTTPGGEKYEGAFKNNAIHGFGKYYYANGDTYEGDWDDHRRHGKGKYSNKSGELYEGDYLNDKPHGKGKYTSAFGDIYEGEYVNGKREGKGKLSNKNGDVYEGMFKSGVLNGEVILKQKNGTIKQGTWVNGMQTGFIKITFPGKDVYEGEAKSGFVSVRGKYFRKGILQYEGQFGENQYRKKDTAWLVEPGVFLVRKTFNNNQFSKSDFFEQYYTDGKIFFGNIRPIAEGDGITSKMQPYKGIIIFPDGNVIGGEWQAFPKYDGRLDTISTRYKYYQSKTKFIEAELFYYKALAASQTGWPFLAVKFFDEAEKKKLSNDSIYYYRAVACRQAELYERGIADMNTFLKKPPKSDAPYRLLVAMHQNNKDTAGAMMVLDKWIKQFPKDSSVSQLRGDMLIQQNKFGEAVPDILKSISLRKGDKSWSYLALGKCYERLGRLPDACANYKLVTNTFYLEDARKRIAALKCQ